MSTANSQLNLTAARIVHWIGCLLGIAGVVLFIVLSVGEGLPPLAAMNASFAALAVMLVGYVLVWWNDLVGGIVSLAGIICFEALEVVANGHPAGGVFYLFFVPGVVSILAWFLRDGRTN